VYAFRQSFDSYGGVLYDLEWPRAKSFRRWPGGFSVIRLLPGSSFGKTSPALRVRVACSFLFYVRKSVGGATWRSFLGTIRRTNLVLRGIQNIFEMHVRGWSVFARVSEVAL